MLMKSLLLPAFDQLVGVSILSFSCWPRARVEHIHHNVDSIKSRDLHLRYCSRFGHIDPQSRHCPTICSWDFSHSPGLRLCNFLLKILLLPAFDQLVGVTIWSSACWPRVRVEHIHDKVKSIRHWELLFSRDIVSYVKKDSGAQHCDEHMSI